jgi:NAD(P)-dependent dehydrogenase (short-subunit alcohol dehydrogenase family)
MNGLLQGRVAVITGASRERGIGLATARLFAEHGARVALLDLDAADAQAAAVALGPQHIGLACDVRDAAACRAAIDQATQRLGPVDVLVNNAGLTQRRGVMEVTADDYTTVTDVVLARELGPDQVRVNAVAPGLILTDFSRGANSDDNKHALAKSFPLQHPRPRRLASAHARQVARARPSVAGGRRCAPDDGAARTRAVAPAPAPSASPTSPRRRELMAAKRSSCTAPDELQAGRTGYSSGRGEAAVLKALAAKYSARTGRDVGSDQFIWVPGTQSALYLLLTGLVETGDEVLLADPCYATYHGLVRPPARARCRWRCAKHAASGCTPTTWRAR